MNFVAKEKKTGVSIISVVPRVGRLGETGGDCKARTSDEWTMSGSDVLSADALMENHGARKGQCKAKKVSWQGYMCNGVIGQGVPGASFKVV